MKFAVVVAIFVACASATHFRAVEPRSTAVINQYVDTILKQIDKFIINQGLDPMHLEDIVKSFSVKPIIITYHGELDLKNGWLQNLSKMTRGGDAELSYEAMFLNIKLPIMFENLQADFDYTAKLMDLTHSGGVGANIANVHLYVDVTVDTKTLEVSLQDFKITETGKIDVSFSGHQLIDWLANALSDVVTGIFHEQVQGAIEGEVKAMLQSAIDQINSMRPGQKEYLFNQLPLFV